jgi:hypothetical protein
MYAFTTSFLIDIVFHPQVLQPHHVIPIGNGFQVSNIGYGLYSSKLFPKMRLILRRNAKTAGSYQNSSHLTLLELDPHRMTVKQIIGDRNFTRQVNNETGRLPVGVDYAYIINVKRIIKMLSNKISAR